MGSEMCIRDSNPSEEYRAKNKGKKDETENPSNRHRDCRIKLVFNAVTKIDTHKFFSFYVATQLNPIDYVDKEVVKECWKAPLWPPGGSA